jgi:putative DNA primase/helicase
MPDTDAAFEALFTESVAGSSPRGPLDPEYEWPEPEPFNVVKPAKPFPIAALPPTIRLAVIETQLLTQAPVEMVVASAWSAASLAAQGHADVARDASLVGPIGIYNITIGLSGERKSAIDNKLWSGCRNAADSIHQLREQEIALAVARIKIWEGKRDALQKELTRLIKGGPPAPTWVTAFHAAQAQIPGTPPAGRPSQQAMISFLEAQLIAHHTNKPPVPKSADLLHADDTSEALVESLAAGWPVAALAEAEGGVVFGGVAMHKERVMQTFASWNVLWDGGRITHKRTSVESRRVRDVRLTINLMIQPAILERVINDNAGLIRDIGLQSRFLFCYPASTMGGRPYQPPVQTPQAIIDFNSRCFSLLVSVPLPHPVTATGAIDTTRVKPPVLPLSTAAHAGWVAYYNRIERDLIGQFDDIKDVASKAAEQAARLAAIFWVFENNRAPVPGDEIPEPTMFSAIVVAAWFLRETQRVLQAFSRSEVERRAEELLAWLLARGQPHIFASDILNLGPPATRKRGYRDLALTVLRDRGLAETDKDAAGKRVVVLNPGLTAPAAGP